MSDELLIAVIAVVGVSVPVFITSLTTIILAISARKEAREARSEAKEELKAIAADQSRKLDETGVKLDTIHEQTNSNLTEQKRQVQALTDEIKALRTERDTKAGAEGAAHE